MAGTSSWRRCCLRIPPALRLSRRLGLRRMSLTQCRFWPQGRGWMQLEEKNRAKKKEERKREREHRCPQNNRAGALD